MRKENRKQIRVSQCIEKKPFAPLNIEELCKSEFSELSIRQRKAGESLLELEKVIKRLVSFAFLNAPEGVLHTLA